MGECNHVVSFQEGVHPSPCMCTRLLRSLVNSRSRLRGGCIAVCPLRPKQKREESMNAGDRRELFALIDWKDMRQSSPPHFS
jgi:hypothetical protein